MSAIVRFRGWQRDLAELPYVSILAILKSSEIRNCRAESQMTVEQEILRYARENAGAAFDEIPTEVRPRVREIIVNHLECEMGLCESSRRPGPGLESSLLDEFAVLNLDWRLVAQTEVGECRLQGFVASQPSGAIVRRMEAYKGMCPACAEMNGRTFTVVSPNAQNKNWQTEVWRGKSRVHYSMMVERAQVRDWPSAGLQHPGCRGSWMLLHTRPPEVSQQFADWLDRLLAKPKF